MFGLSFAPNGNPGAPGDPTQRPLAPNGNNVSPLQTAIRTLSLRLPNALGPQPVSPGLLLNSPGATGFHGGAGQPFDLMAQLQQLFGNRQGQPGAMGLPPTGGMSAAPPMGAPQGGGMSMPSAPSAPAPSITFGNGSLAPIGNMGTSVPDQQHQGFQDFFQRERGLGGGPTMPGGLR